MKFLGGISPKSDHQSRRTRMAPFARRPPRPAKKIFHIVFLFSAVLADGCASSSVQRTNEIRTQIQNNLFSTEHLAFGADPRSVNAVRAMTTEADIPSLAALLGDPNPSVVRVAQYVLVSYEEKAIPHLEMIGNGSASTVVSETIEMIRNRKTQ
jgi:hypothetical protein